MELGEFCPTREHALLGVFVVNGGVFLFWWLVRRLMTAPRDRSFLGFYFILMPVGFFVWFNPRNLAMWLALALAMAGSVILCRATGLDNPGLGEKKAGSVESA